MDFINSSQLQSKEAQDSFAAQIMRIMPNGMAPIFAMSGLAKKKFIPNIEHGWWSKTMQFVKATLATAISSNATTAVVWITLMVFWLALYCVYQLSLVLPTLPLN